MKEIKTNLGRKPKEATTIIKIFNSKSREELEKLGIQDRIETILELKRMHSNRNLMLQLENKC